MKILLFIVALCILTFAVFFFYPKETNMYQAPSPKNTSTPMPFADITIPYLRAREYKSELGIQTAYQSRATYNSFVTSYNSDGFKVEGLLTVPKGLMPEGGWPAIVFVHGYIPPTLYKTTERYGDYVDYLARNGFVVFKIDLRGNGNSEGEPSGSYYSSGYVIDTLNAYAALSSADFVNKNKIGLWGHSMAGNLLLRAFAAKPTIPAVVIWAGAGYSYTDLATYGLNDNSYRPPNTPNTQGNRRQLLMQTYGQPTAESEFWKTVAPTNYLSDLKGTIALHHAKDDSVVSIRYSEDLNEMLNKTAVPHEFFTYSSGGHNLSGGSFGVAMERTVAFFKKYL